MNILYSMRAVVAVPSLKDFYFTPHRASALGARSVAKVLQDLGWETELIIFPLSAKRGIPLDLPKELCHLSPHILQGEQGPTSFFHRYHRFGPPAEEAAAEILSRAPDLVLISCFAWAYAEDARDLAGRLKALEPKLPVILGGGGASVLPAYFLPPFNPVWPPDYILGGEAETQLPGLLETFPAPLSEPRVIPFEPAQAAEQLPVLWGPTRARKHTQINLHLSRGCSRHCRFCSNHLTQGRKFRKAPLSAMEQAVEEIRLSIGGDRDIPVTFNLEDDNLLLDPDYMIEVLEIIKNVFPRASFKAENGLDYRLLSTDLQTLLLDLGFVQFNVSLVQSNPELLKQQHRASGADRFLALLDVAEERRVPVISYFIAGLPGDSRENLIDQLTFLAGLPTGIGISLFYPVPGLPGFEDPEPFLKHPPGLCTGSSAWPWGASLSTGEMVTAFRLARMINFLKRDPKNPREEEMRRQLVSQRRLLTWRKEHPEGIVPPGVEENLASGLWERLGSVFCS